MDKISRALRIARRMAEGGRQNSLVSEDAGPYGRHNLDLSIPLTRDIDVTGRGWVHPYSQGPNIRRSDFGAQIGLRKRFADGGSIRDVVFDPKPMNPGKTPNQRVQEGHQEFEQGYIRGWDYEGAPIMNMRGKQLTLRRAADGGAQRTAGFPEKPEGYEFYGPNDNPVDTTPVPNTEGMLSYDPAQEPPRRGPPAVMEPTLQEAQTGEVSGLPEGGKYQVDELGRIVDVSTPNWDPVQFTPRTNISPWTKTPQGDIEANIPKMFDIAGNLGGGWSVPVRGAEAVLGAGAAMPKKLPPVGEAAKPSIPPQLHFPEWAQSSQSKGTGPGALFTNTQTGQQVYAKVPHTIDHLNNELMASEFYKLAGIPAAEYHATKIKDAQKLAIGSEIIPGKQLSEFPASDYNTKIKGLREGRPIDAFLANWDVAGAGVENPLGNIIVDNNGVAHRIDFGGALRFGGLGGEKGAKFNANVDELIKMVDPKTNKTAASIYDISHVPPDEQLKILERERQVAAKVAGITDNQITNLVYKYGPADPGEKDKLRKLLIARREKIAQEYGIGKLGPASEGVQQIADKFGVSHLYDKPTSEPPRDDFIESMESLGLKKSSGPPLKPMQLTKKHSPEDYIHALSSQSYLGALAKQKVTTKQGTNILKNFQNMDQDKLAKAVAHLPPAEMANLATWAQPGVIKKLWEAQKKKMTPLKEIYGVEPKELADELVNKARGDSVEIAEGLYAIATKNPNLADEVNKLLPTRGMDDVANYMNVLIGKKGDPWMVKEPQLKKSGKNYTQDDIDDYWDKVDQGIKNDWELAQGGTDFIKKINKAWTSHFDPFFKEMGPQDWLSYKPKEWVKQVVKELLPKEPKVEFKNKSHKQLRAMGINPDVPIWKGGYKKGKYPEKIHDPSMKYSEKGWFAAPLHFIAESYGSSKNHVNPYVYGGKDIKIGRISFKDSHNGDASYENGDMPGLLEAARSRGFDMVIIEDIADVGSHTVGLHTQFAFLNTKGLRAPHAEFDPNKLKLAHPNPLWGLVGGGLFSYGMLKGQEKDESKMATGGQVMPLKPGSSKKVISENISEFHGGKTYNATKAKFGKAKADKQAIAVALSTARKYGKAGGGASTIANMAMKGSTIKLGREGMLNSTIPGRTDKLPMKVKAGSYVLPADIPSALGQGNTMAGGEILKKMFSSGPYGMFPMKGGRGSIRPRLKADGGEAENEGEDGDDHVPIIAAGGEYIIPPEVVQDIGHGSMKAGHDVLDKLVLKIRKHHIETLKKLKPPKK